MNRRRSKHLRSTINVNFVPRGWTSKSIEARKITLFGTQRDSSSTQRTRTEAKLRQELVRKIEIRVSASPEQSAGKDTIEISLAIQTSAEPGEDRRRRRPRALHSTVPRAPSPCLLAIACRFRCLSWIVASAYLGNSSAIVAFNLSHARRFAKITANDVTEGVLVTAKERDNSLGTSKERTRLKRTAAQRRLWAF